MITVFESKPTHRLFLVFICLTDLAKFEMTNTVLNKDQMTKKKRSPPANLRTSIKNK